MLIIIASKAIKNMPLNAFGNIATPSIMKAISGSVRFGNNCRAVNPHSIMTKSIAIHIITEYIIDFSEHLFDFEAKNL